MNKDLEFIKETLKDSFDIKYREINSMLGKATIVFADVLCSTAFISDYIVKPLIKEKRDDINTQEDIISKVLQINIVDFAKDLSLIHI